MADSTRPTLVLIHAFPLHSGMWEPQFEELSDFAEIYTPNLPGFGGQPGLDEETFTMERVARYLQQDLESRNIERCILGGLSMGGYIAFECWRQFPERIAGLILADTKAAADTEEGRRKRFEAAEKISAGGYEGWVGSMLERLLAERTRDDRPEIVDAVRAIMLDSPPESSIAALLGMADRRDSTSLLRTITVPTAIIVGEHDEITNEEEARHMAEHVQDVTLEIISDAGHLSNIENPEAFNAAVRGLMERIEVGSFEF